MLRKPINNKSYDFESPDEWFGYKFLSVLERLDIYPAEHYLGFDGAAIEFFTTKKKRLQAEYIFRRLVGLGRTEYLSDLDGYQDRQARYEEERYAIY